MFIRAEKNILLCYSGLNSASSDLRDLPMCFELEGNKGNARFQLCYTITKICCI